MRFAGSNKQIHEFLAQGNDYGELANFGQQARGFEQQKAFENEGIVAGHGLNAFAKVNSAMHQARGIEAQGEAAGQIASAQGMASGISSIAGGLGKMFG